MTPVPAMMSLLETTVTCPYCGEANDLLVEPEALDGCTIEDCRVCCRPMVLLWLPDALGSVQVRALREDETP